MQGYDHCCRAGLFCPETDFTNFEFLQSLNKAFEANDEKTVKPRVNARGISKARSQLKKDRWMAQHKKDTM